MAKITNPYICDVCSTQKQPSNGWFIFVDTLTSPPMETVNAAAQQPPRHDMQQAPKIEIFPWDKSLADCPDVKHLCGAECASKLIARTLNRYQQQTGGASTVNGNTIPYDEKDTPGTWRDVTWEFNNK